MGKILTILSVLALSALVTFGLGQQEGNYGGGLSGDFAGGFFKKDTTFIINWNFDTGMPNVTEVGGVGIVVHPTNSVVTDSVLEVTVSGGGNDHIYQTIPNFNEVWLRINFRLSDADTSGWDANETLNISYIGESGVTNGKVSLVVRRYINDLVWQLNFRDADDTDRSPRPFSWLIYTCKNTDVICL